MYFSVAKAFFHFLSIASVTTRVVLSSVQTIDNPLVWLDIAVGVVAAFAVLYTARKFVQAFLHVTFVAAAWVVCIIIITEFAKLEEVQSTVQTSKVAFLALIKHFEDAYRNATIPEARP
jgi:hypothetical protein